MPPRKEVGEYIFQGVKISLGLLLEAAGWVPVPYVQRATTAASTLITIGEVWPT